MLFEIYGQSMSANRVKTKVTVKLTGSTVTIIVTQVLDVYALQMLKYTCLGLVSIMLKVDASELHTCLLSVHSLPHQINVPVARFSLMTVFIHVFELSYLSACTDSYCSDNFPRYICCGPYILKVGCGL